MWKWSVLLLCPAYHMNDVSQDCLLSVDKVTVEIPYLYFVVILSVFFSLSLLLLLFLKLKVEMLLLTCIVIEGESAPSAGFVGIM